MGYIAGYVTAGIFQTQAEVDKWAETNNDSGNMSQKAPGDIIYVDIYGPPIEEGTLENHEPDGIINSYDQTYLGKTIPGYYYGFSLGADYKNWDIVLNFNGRGDVQDTYTNGLNSINGGGQNFLTAYRNRWTPTNPSNTIPRAIQNNPSANNRTADRHVFNAGFLRFQNFQIGYNFRSSLINRVGINNLRCYITGSNIFVISPYPDLDPENVTTPTTFTLGINVSF